MSVSIFNAQELGNIVKAFAPGNFDLDVMRFVALYKALALFSRANAKAYRSAYAHLYHGVQIRGATEMAIYKAAKAIEQPDLVRALQSVALLEYNTEDNNGKCYADKKCRAAIMSVLTVAVQVATARIEGRAE